MATVREEILWRGTVAIGVVVTVLTCVVLCLLGQPRTPADRLNTYAPAGAGRWEPAEGGASRLKVTCGWLYAMNQGDGLAFVPDGTCK